MNKLEIHFPSGELRKVKYGKRYGYWWKEHRRLAKEIKDYKPYIDYFGHLEYRLDKPMSKKHLLRWNKEINEQI